MGNAYPINGDRVKFGPVELVKPANMLVFIGGWNTAGRYSCLMNENSFSAGAVTGYQVTAGKTLRLFGFELWSTNAANVDMLVGYGDAAINTDAAAGPAGAVFSGVNGGINISLYGLQFTAALQSAVQQACILDIPATKYPCVLATTGTNGRFKFYGYEY